MNILVEIPAMMDEPSLLRETSNFSLNLEFTGLALHIEKFYNTIMIIL